VGGWLQTPKSTYQTLVRTDRGKRGIQAPSPKGALYPERKRGSGEKTKEIVWEKKSPGEKKGAVGLGPSAKKGPGGQKAEKGKKKKRDATVRSVKLEARGKQTIKKKKP